MAADGAAAETHAIVPMILSPLTKRGRSALLDAATEGGGDELQLQRILLLGEGSCEQAAMVAQARASPLPDLFRAGSRRY